jgi:hypothetical protein
MTKDQIRRWRERAEKIHYTSRWDMGKAIVLAEEIHRWSLAPLRGAAEFFLGQTKRKEMDIEMSAPRNSFYRLLLILREEEDRSG